MVRYYPEDSFDRDTLMHYGILGMKWGVRRYQNEDGTRTPLGKARERKGNGRKAARTAAKVAAGIGVAAGLKAIGSSARKRGSKLTDEQKDYLFEQNQKDGKDKAPISRVEKAGKNLSKTAEQTGKVINRFESKKSAKQEYDERAKRRAQVKRMSDDELRKRVNRLNLEKQYLDLSRTERNPGKWSTQEKIDLGTDVLNGLLSAGSLAISIWALKRGLKV